MEPRLAEAAAGTRTVFFVDSAHFVWSAFLGAVWSLVRRVVRAPSGRLRFNVLGALDAVSHQLVMVANTTYITATQVIELLDKVAALKRTTPITLILDNARYQHCAAVMAHAATLHIELLFLPPYSPNLNLIERLWRFVKNEALYSRYFPDFAHFTAAITSCLAQTQGVHQSALDRLLTLHFQTIIPADFPLG